MNGAGKITAFSPGPEQSVTSLDATGGHHNPAGTSIPVVFRFRGPESDKPHIPREN